MLNEYTVTKISFNNLIFTPLIATNEFYK
jgi:hypothetical protein